MKRREDSQPGRGEQALVLWLALTFLLCVFVALPNRATAPHGSVRRGARAYLRTLGLDQYWKMFVGSDWDMPQLRIIATERSGQSRDVTGTFLDSGLLHRHLLDDRVRFAHLVLARGENPAILASYAEALRMRLGGEVIAIHFEQVFRNARYRGGSKVPTAMVPLAEYRWDHPIQ